MAPSNLVDLELLRSKSAAGEALPTEDIAIRKQFVARIKAAPDGSRKIAFVISTGKADRMNDVINAAGWDLASYEKNPVVLWAHSHYTPPIGRGEKVRVVGKTLKAVAEFAPADVHPLAETVFQLLKGGFLRATSVGFHPKRGAYSWNDERGGYDFEKQELLEFSVVPVPANADALMQAKSAGVLVAPLKAWAEEVLDQAAGPGLWIPRADVEGTYKALARKSVSVPAAGVAPSKVVDAVLVLTKAGRVLSAANEARLRGARDSADELCSALDEVLAQVEEESEKSAPVLTLASEPVYVVDPKDVQAAMLAVVSDVVREKVNFARGRLD
jgi:HK97 family phage prohead protease